MTTPTRQAIDRIVRSNVLDDERPAPPGALSATITFAWRSLVKVRHLPEQVGDVILIPVMFTVMFTYLFGGALATSTDEYLQFILPGTLVMTVVLLTVSTGVGLNTDLATGTFDRFRSMAIWRPSPIVGALVGDLPRYLVAATLVLGLGMLMGFRPGGGISGVASAVALVLLFAFSLSWVWTSLALVLRTPNSVTVAGLVILFPLSFASNVFVDPATMPGWLRTFVDLNPVSHLVSAARGLSHGTSAGAEVAWVLAACVTLGAVFIPVTMLLYRRKG